MKIGICIRGNHLLEDLRNAVAMGFDTVELYFNDQLSDIDWKEIVRILQKGGYQGDIAVEGYHDPVYCGERELEGQRLALEHLRKIIV